MSKVIYGRKGIRNRDYKVWINFSGMTEADGELDYIQAIDAISGTYDKITESPPDYENALTALNATKELMYHIGEMRADSIDLTIEDGDSIEGNIAGKVVLGKSGKFVTELINSTPEILNWLSERDGEECIVMLEEINDKRLVSYDGAMLETHEIIFICNMPAIAAGLTDNVGVVFGFAEKETGNGTITSTINLEKTVAYASMFRKIYDFQYELPSEPPRNIDVSNIEGQPLVALVEWQWSAGDYPAVDGFRIQVSTEVNFSNIILKQDVDGKNEVVDLKAYVTCPKAGKYYFRMCGLIKGVQKSIFSNVVDITL